MTPKIELFRKMIFSIACLSLLVICAGVPVMNETLAITEVAHNGDLVEFSTYLGGSNHETVYGLTLDDSNNIYIIGTTLSSDFPTTQGVYNRTHSGGRDLFVTKMSPDGLTIVFSTLIGPATGFFNGRIALDSSNNIIIAAETDSSNFPTTTGVYDETHNGDSEVVVAKLSTDGSNLIFSTFIGGTAFDEVTSITIDSSDNIFITGTTDSSDFPTTSNAYQQIKNGSTDSYVTKLSADGSNLEFSTFIGGNGNEWFPMIALDSQNNIIISGGTASSNFPTTPSALYSSPIGGSGLNWPPFGIICKDLFISKFSTDGSELLYSSYLGGDGNEYVNAMILDSSDNIIITGATGSTDFPTSSNAYDKIYSGASGGDPNWINDIFVTKIAADGSTVLASTYLGGSGSFEYGRGIELDDSNNIYLTGVTGSSNYPVTANALQPTIGGNDDSFISVLSADMSNLNYSTFFGGSSLEDGYSIHRDDQGFIYITGMTISTDMMSTNAINSTNNGLTDIYVLKMDIPVSTPTTNGPAPGFELFATIAAITIGSIFVKRRRK
ncbi:MAG: Loki-CTERM sorting domain-containing protein [Candidatus Hodarchaeales archaeon]|jgi:hypothetical protein